MKDLNEGDPLAQDEDSSQQRDDRGRVSGQGCKGRTGLFDEREEGREPGSTARQPKHQESHPDCRCRQHQEMRSELNEAIDERVRETNHDIRRADDSTKWERFQAEEVGELGPLPDARFEDVEWKELKAGRNYHVTADF